MDARLHCGKCFAFAAITVAIPNDSGQRKSYEHIGFLGNQATFTASVTNTEDTAVSWSVNGVPGGNVTLGTITSAGVYAVPADMPSPSTVQTTATSHADATKSGTGTLAITSDIALSLCPIRAGRRCKVALSLQWTSASRLGRGLDLEESSKFRVSNFEFPFSIFHFREE